MRRCSISREYHVQPDRLLESLILIKPTDADNHGGGQRFAKDSWQYRMFRKWIEAGASFSPRAMCSKSRGWK